MVDCWFFAELSLEVGLGCSTSGYLLLLLTIAVIICYVRQRTRQMLSLDESETSSGGAAVFSVLNYPAAQTSRPQRLHLLVNLSCIHCNHNLKINQQKKAESIKDEKKII